MKNWIIRHRFEIGLFLFALLARIVLFSVNFSQNEGDLVATIKGDDGYYELSQNIMAGNGFSYMTEPPYDPNPLRPPVWPYLIAFFAKTFGSYWAVLAFELVLGSLIPVLGMHAARHIVGERLSKWVGAAMVFEPYLILLSFILYTETAFTFFFLLSILFFFRYLERETLRNALWFGVFLGLATLIKPTVQYLPVLIPLALAILWRKRLSREHAKHLGAFLAAFLLLIAPWLYRNHAEFGVWGMSAQPAFNLYIYLAPTVLAIDNGTDFRTELANFAKKDGFDENSINLSNSDFYRDKALETILEHKAALIKSILITAVTFFTHDGMLTFLAYSDVRFENIVAKPVIALLSSPGELLSVVAHYAKSPAVLVLVFRLLWILVALSFFFGAFMYARREGVKTQALAAFLIVLYFAATTAINGFGVNARFRVPVDAFIFSFAFYGFLITWYGIRSRFPRNAQAIDRNPGI